MKVRPLWAGAALGALALLQPYRLFVVDGTSMAPTLANGQFLLGNVRPRAIARGDVVVFRHEGETLVKRVAYLPGDWIDRYWLFGEWKTPVNALMDRAMVRQNCRREREVVPTGALYVLADDPYGTIDSRSLGPIPMSEVLAVAPDVDRRAEWDLASAHLGASAVARL